MGVYDNYKTDLKIETEGVLIEEADYRYWVARAGKSNKAYIKAITKLNRKHERQINTGTMDEAVGDRIIRKAYAETIVKRWEIKVDGEWVEGFHRVDGSIAMGPVQVKDLIALFDEVPEIFTQLMEDAGNLAYYLIERTEADAKNS